MLTLKLLMLALLANGTPVLVKRLLGQRFSRPVDGGLRFIDGQPLFGRSKTLRGIVVAVPVTSAGAWLMELGWEIGALFGAASLTGDLLSSFSKRRMKLAPSSRATGLDQIPEVLLPLLVCQPLLELTVLQIVAVVVLFFASDVFLSPLFFRLKIRDRPY
ncbi:MAG TPA: CDP-archaeol synthase [Gammaproteobacteria bacterium]|nr:CDP-archaeol synthase [Gammaproteobacteria bacterium]